MPMVPVVLILAASLASAAEPATSFKFAFTPGKAAPGYIQVPPSAVYTKEAGSGFDLGTTGAAAPFYFSVAVPEGNYNVTATLGDAAAECVTTVRAESRRLMLEKVRTGPGKFEARTFTVNVRNSRLAPPPANAPGGSQVRLNDREQGVLHWDDKLTLEFHSARPCLSALEIEKVDDIPTVYLAGDSTVTDQARGPTTSWGQMLPRFFKPGVAVANHAESGETLKSFITALRLDKVLSQMKKGDYLFIQFGHNDMKQNWPQTYVEPSTTYKAYLKVFIAEARRRGATPVLVTSMHRRSFGPDGKIANTLGEFPEAVRQTAKEEQVALIDLHAMSAALYEALGPEKSTLAFGANGRDGTHHSAYGAYELAKCVVEGIKANKLDLAKYLVDDVPPFDPAHPDPPEAWSVPETAAQAPPPMPMPEPADPKLPSLFLIGDSTVRNGRGDGRNGQWGWGEPIAGLFDKTKINVVSRALGGRSSRTYLTEGQWDRVLAMLKPGDFVMMQFGHNDGGAVNDTSRARGALKGIGEETEEIDNLLTRKHEIVHTYGWYLRKFIADARAKGATPIVCSLVPRKIWADGKIVREDYVQWAASVAQSEHAAFVDLNEIVARRYEELGPEKVNTLFADERTHTTLEGAEINAASVIAGLKGLKDNPLAAYFSGGKAKMQVVDKVM